MSFIFLCLYIICTFIRPQEWVPVFYGSPIVNILSLIVVFFLIFERLMASKQGFTRVPQNKMMLGLYGAIIMSHVVHTYFAGMMMSIQSFLVTITLYFILLNGINSRFKLKTALWLIVILNVVLVYQGMYQLENVAGWAGQFPIVQGGKYTEFVRRITWVGIFSDPNDLALTFVIAIGILLPFVFGKSNLFTWGLASVLLGFLLYGIYITNSRGGLLALMATVYFFMVRKTGKLFWGGIIGAGLAAIVLILGPSRAGNITTAEASAYSRVELWYQGLEMLKSNPVFGVGFDMFTDYLPKTAHNSFVLAAAELGFVGLFMWMGLLYVSYNGLSKIQEKSQNLQKYALGLQSGLVGFCAAAFFLSRTYVIIPYMIFALSGSMMQMAKDEDNSLDFRITKRDLGRVFWLTLGMIVLIYITIKVAI